jgi:hypothetical protein
MKWIFLPAIACKIGSSNSIFQTGELQKPSADKYEERVMHTRQVCQLLHKGANSRTANWKTLLEILIISSNILSTLSK